MPVYDKISIRLIRDGTSGPHEDDRIHITREDNNIKVTYMDYERGVENQRQQVTQKILLTHTALDSYIKNLGQLFLHDTQPFKQIQFNFPGFPCFLATRKTLKDTDLQDTLMEISNIVSESWFADYSCCSEEFHDKFESHY
jgi:hypothetical protein